MCKVTMTKYGCEHTTKTYRPCEKGHDASTMLGCFSTKAKYCSHPRVEPKGPLEGLCENCRKEAVKKSGRKPRSESKHRIPLGRSASVKELPPPKIKVMSGSATGRHEFFQADPPSRGRSKSKGKSRDTSRPPPLAPRHVPNTAPDKGKGRSTSVPPELTRLPATVYNPNGPSVANFPHDKAAVPPPVGSITNYKNKPLPHVPPNSSKSSKIGGSSASTSRSTSHSRNGRPGSSAAPAPPQSRQRSRSRGREQKGKEPAHPVTLGPHPQRPLRGDVNAPIRESQRFINPRPVPAFPTIGPQHTIRSDLPKIIAELRLEQLERERRERGRAPVPQQPPPHQPYIKIGFKPHEHTQQRQTGQVSHSQPHHYPPSASKHIEIYAPVPRRKISKTRLNEAADHFFGGSHNSSGSRSTSKTRERSSSRSRAHGKDKHHDKHDKHDKKHQKQPSTASSFMNKIRAGLGGSDDNGDDSDSDSSWACQESRAIERGESTLPSRNTSRRTSVNHGGHGGSYMHGALQI
ncbi:hypothetical protein QBC45DRAFT_484832 [Copromyces sp. CBS 386.78]|nr:hypothetical protein QBC45DRAFT_484832 [Copromyces sp. CBS 386.78]